MKFGLSDAELEFLRGVAVLPFSSMGLSVFCFGSRARGDHNRFSDIDLMLEGGKSPSAEKLKSEIEEILSNSNFPYKVELVFREDYAPAYTQGYLRDRKSFQDDRVD